MSLLGRRTHSGRFYHHCPFTRGAGPGWASFLLLAQSRSLRHRPEDTKSKDKQQPCGSTGPHHGATVHAAPAQTHPQCSKGNSSGLCDPQPLPQAFRSEGLHGLVLAVPNSWVERSSALAEEPTALACSLPALPELCPLLTLGQASGADPITPGQTLAPAATLPCLCGITHTALTSTGPGTPGDIRLLGTPALNCKM